MRFQQQSEVKIPIQTTISIVFVIARQGVTLRLILWAVIKGPECRSQWHLAVSLQIANTSSALPFYTCRRTAPKVARNAISHTWSQCLVGPSWVSVETWRWIMATSVEEDNNSYFQVIQQ